MALYRTSGAPDISSLNVTQINSGGLSSGQTITSLNIDVSTGVKAFGAAASTASPNQLSIEAIFVNGEMIWKNSYVDYTVSNGIIQGGSKSPSYGGSWSLYEFTV